MTSRATRNYRRQEPASATGLANAFEKNNAAQVAEILAEAPHLATDIDATGSSVAFFAARSSSAECLAVILPFFDPLFQSTDGTTALMHAAMGSNLDCMRLLLPLSDPNAQALNGWTALMRCCALGYFQGIELLLPATDASLQGRRSGRMLAASDILADCNHALTPGGKLLFDRLKIAEERAAIASASLPCPASIARPLRL